MRPGGAWLSTRSAHCQPAAARHPFVRRRQPQTRLSATPMLAQQNGRQAVPSGTASPARPQSKSLAPERLAGCLACPPCWSAALARRCVGPDILAGSVTRRFCGTCLGGTRRRGGSAEAATLRMDGDVAIGGQG